MTVALSAAAPWPDPEGDCSFRSSSGRLSFGEGVGVRSPQQSAELRLQLDASAAGLASLEAALDEAEAEMGGRAGSARYAAVTDRRRISDAARLAADLSATRAVAAALRFELEEARARRAADIAAANARLAALSDERRTLREANAQLAAERDALLAANARLAERLGMGHEWVAQVEGGGAASRPAVSALRDGAGARADGAGVAREAGVAATARVGRGGTRPGCEVGPGGAAAHDGAGG